MLRLRFMPLAKIAAGFRLAWGNRAKGDADTGEISPFQALMTSLAATVGTGNIAGVATAIFLGGPGALFWMWVTALVGMATKYSEVLLAVHFRERDARGEFTGGPMYAIRNGLGPGGRGWARCSRCLAAWPASASATWCRSTAWPTRWVRPSAFLTGRRAWRPWC